MEILALQYLYLEDVVVKEFVVDESCTVCLRSLVKRESEMVECNAADLYGISSKSTNKGEARYISL